MTTTNRARAHASAHRDLLAEAAGQLACDAQIAASHARGLAPERAIIVLRSASDDLLRALAKVEGAGERSSPKPLASGLRQVLKRISANPTPDARARVRSAFELKAGDGMQRLPELIHVLQLAHGALDGPDPEAALGYLSIAGGLEGISALGDSLAAMVRDLSREATPRRGRRAA